MTKLIIAFRCVANIPKKGFSLNVDVFPGGKERPGRDADPSPTSTAVVNKEQSYTSTPPMGRTACTQPQCQYSTAIPLLPLWAVRPVHSLSASTVQLYLYSPYGPYGLYRASVPVQGCTLPLILTFKILILEYTKTNFQNTFRHV